VIVELPTAADPVRLIQGDCLDVLRALPDGCVDAVVTDPPYGLEFMGKEWDKFGGGKVGTPGIGDRTTPWVSNQGWNGMRCRKCGHLPHGGSPCHCPDPDIRAADDRWKKFQAFNEAWATAALRVLKPGGYMLAFGGTRTYHRLTCAVEDAGFEVRDCLMWLYGTGFPKGKGCLKPAWEPVLLARKPGPKVLPLNIDACRVPTGDDTGRTRHTALGRMNDDGWQPSSQESDSHPAGRYPANVTHDGSAEVLDAFAAFGEKTSGSRKAGEYQPQGFYGNAIADRPAGMERPMPELTGDTGTAARFYFCAKASRSERVTLPDGTSHPTVKPLELVRWLVQLVTPEGGTVLDPFSGSGTTGVAALSEGRRAVLVEKEPGYCDIIRKRLAHALGTSAGSLFAGAEL
jgi:site-specific DNA-methyltransferase (adenine-specific)